MPLVWVFDTQFPTFFLLGGFCSNFVYRRPFACRSRWFLSRTPSSWRIMHFWDEFRSNFVVFCRWVHERSIPVKLAIFCSFRFLKHRIVWRNNNIFFASECTDSLEMHQRYLSITFLRVLQNFEHTVDILKKKKNAQFYGNGSLWHLRCRSLAWDVVQT